MYGFCSYRLQLGRRRGSHERYVTARKQVTDKWALDFAIWLAKVILLFAALFGLLVFAIAMLATFSF